MGFNGTSKGDSERLTKPTVAPVKRTRKNALVPVASSQGLRTLVKTWCGAWKSIPMPMPAIKGYAIWATTFAFSSKRFNSPERHQTISLSYLGKFSYRSLKCRWATQSRLSNFDHWYHESVVANTQWTRLPAWMPGTTQESKADSWFQIPGVTIQ